MTAVNQAPINGEFGGHEEGAGSHRRPHGPLGGVDTAEAVADYELALTSRALDDRQITLQKQSRVFFQISGAGHEVILLALARELRPDVDWFFPYYRDQALMLGLGATPEQIMLQAVGSSDDPNSGGRQMPSHWGARELHVVSQSSPTGSQCIPAVGCAEAGRYITQRGGLPGCDGVDGEVTYVSLGEGAVCEGEFWEALDSACTLALPVLFHVADNGWAISVPSSQQAPAPVSQLVSGFRGLQVFTVDGTDYLAARRVAREAVAAARRGPVLLHSTVTRPYSHSAADTQSKYRSRLDLDVERQRDPIRRLRSALVDSGVLDESGAEEIEQRAKERVRSAAQAALAAPQPDPATVTRYVVDPPQVIEGSPDPAPAAFPAAAPASSPAAPPAASAANGVGNDRPTGNGSAPMMLGPAITAVLREQMALDERVRVFGEDVADAPEAVIEDVEGKGGVFGLTHGLQWEFGEDRCYNTPLSEAGIVGRAIGQAVRGLRPVAEIQFMDYIWPATQQIKSEAATMRWRSNNAFTCPAVIRVASGGYLQGGAIWHSQCGEAFWAHVPGLLIAFPSRARDAVGLLRTAILAEDPVLFCEHKHLLRQKYTADPFPGPDYRIPFGRGAVRRSGTDVTVVTWGATVHKSLQAAEQLEGEVSVEVIDLRTIMPWDAELVAESVSRTHRVLVVHEDILTGGFGAEIAATIGEHSFTQLDAPVRRLAALDTHVPYAPALEDAVLPQTADVAEAIRQLNQF